MDWNKKVPHILVTGSSGGFATVWDVKAKKESLNLNNLGRKAVSAIAWDPDAHTRLATATSNDQEPVILIWDLRNSNAPERTLRLHDQGILSLSWCQQDPRLLLSAGKDNRTICWDVQTGKALGEFPIVTNWTFQTRWDTYSPGLLATASFDGKISVHNIQSTNVDSAKAATPVVDGADFFASAGSRPQGAGFSLLTAPQWLKRPVSARFGFGGKLVKVGSSKTGSTVSISTFVADPTVGETSEKFEEVVQKGDYASFCESKIADASTDEDKADWAVIETLISGSRTKLVEYLGFSRSALKAASETSKQPNGTAAPGDEASFFDNAENGDNFLSNLASNKGVKTNNPFQIYSGSESEADRKITQALTLGAFDEALDVCLKEDRMADAFMIAICGSQKCIDKAQTAYFKRKGDGPNYLRLIASVVGKNLWDVVYNADLSNWKETMATLCTFADQKEFPDLCEALGDRLEEALQNGETISTRKDASFCYLAGSKLEKVAANWAEELKENEKAGLEDSEAESSFAIHAKALQDFIEKVTVFRQVTNFEDTEKSKDANWKLAPLYDKYTEYADILASQGHLEIAAKYLDLLPSQYEAAGVAKERIKQATRKAAPVTQKATVATTAGQRGQRVVPTYQTQQPTIPGPSPPSASQYAPAGASVPAAQSNPYAPAGYQPLQQSGYQPTGYAPPQQSYGGYQPPYGGVAPPPRNTSASPSMPPPSKASNLHSWNDTPDFGPKQPSRKGTPSVVTQPVPSPFANQPTGIAPPSTAPFGAQQRETPPLRPPPKAGTPRVSSPPTTDAPPFDQYQPPSATSGYTPPTTSHTLPQPQLPPVPRGASPYNPPPTASASTSSRYAPVTGSQPAPSQPGPGAPPPTRHIAPPPTGAHASPNPNPYAASPATSRPPPAVPLGVPPRASGTPTAAPVAPPPMGRTKEPSAGVESTSRPTSSASYKAPAAQKYPPGDRSHIPLLAQPIYEILSAEMARVKAKAPQQFKPQVLDTEKRLNILFDHLNNEDLLKPDTVAEMGELARAMDERRHDDAQSLFTDLMTNRTEEGSNWMVSEFCYLCYHGRVLFPRKRRKYVLNKDLQRRILMRIAIAEDVECGRVAPANRDEESADVLLGRGQEAHSNESRHAVVSGRPGPAEEKVVMSKGLGRMWMEPVGKKEQRNESEGEVGEGQEAHSDGPRDAVVGEKPAEDRFAVCEGLRQAWRERAEKDQENENGWKVGELVHKEVITLEHRRDMSNSHVWNELISCWQRKGGVESVRE